MTPNVSTKKRNNSETVVNNRERESGHETSTRFLGRLLIAVSADVFSFLLYFHIHFIHIDPTHSTPLHLTPLLFLFHSIPFHPIPSHSSNKYLSLSFPHISSLTPPTMTSAPRPINALAPKGGNTTRSNTEETLFSSSPRLDAATRLLSTSPSPRLSSRNNNNNNNNNQAFTPSSSWRSPSTLQNFRRLSTDGYQSGGENNNKPSLNAPVVGSYQSIYSLNADTPYSGMEIPADEASKVVKKHLVLSARNSFESDRALNNNGVGYDTGDESGNESGTGSRSRAAPVDYNAAFRLPGGAITRDVYKWQADQENEQLRRGECLFVVSLTLPLSFSFFLFSLDWIMLVFFIACMQDPQTSLSDAFLPRSPLSTFFFISNPRQIALEQRKDTKKTRGIRQRPPNLPNPPNQPTQPTHPKVR